MQGEWNPAAPFLSVQRPSVSSSSPRIFRNYFAWNSILGCSTVCLRPLLTISRYWEEAKVISRGATAIRKGAKAGNVHISVSFLLSKSVHRRVTSLQDLDFRINASSGKHNTRHDVFIIKFCVDVFYALYALSEIKIGQEVKL